MSSSFGSCTSVASSSLTQPNSPKAQVTPADLRRVRAAAKDTNLDQCQDATKRAESNRARRDTYTPSALTPDQQQIVTDLQARDREVRSHEAAHQAASGGNAGGASFTYQTGPDGRQYAIGGEVPIDMSPVSGDPQATIAKLEQVRAAALAPAQPSSQDIAVAAAASQQIAETQRELSRLLAEQNHTDGSQAASPATATSQSAAPGQDNKKVTESRPAESPAQAPNYTQRKAVAAYADATALATA